MVLEVNFYSGKKSLIAIYKHLQLDDPVEISRIIMSKEHTINIATSHFKIYT